MTSLRREGHAAVNPAHGLDVAFAVFVNFGMAAGSEVLENLRAVHVRFRRGKLKTLGQRVEADVLAPPSAPLVHRIEHGRVSKAGKRDLSRRLDLVDDGTLVEEAQVEIQDIMADEEIDFWCQLPEAPQDFRFLSLKHCGRGVVRRFCGVGETKNSGRYSRKTQLLDKFLLIELPLGGVEAVFCYGCRRRDGLDVKEKSLHRREFTIPLRFRFL